MTHSKAIYGTPQISVLQTLKNIYAIHHCGRGLWALVVTFLCLSCVAVYNVNEAPKVYVAGDVALADIAADRDLLVEDAQATKAKREQVLRVQPMVYDLDLEAFPVLQGKILDLFKEVNEIGPEKKYTHVGQLMDTLTPDVAEDVILQISRPDVQSLIIKDLLPFLRTALNAGVVSDVRSAQVGSTGVIIRSKPESTEILRPDVRLLPDMHTLLLEVNSRLRKDPSLTAQTQRAVTVLLSALAPASLHYNKEATLKRSETIGGEVEPVLYHMQRGEVIVRKGERVSAEQQVKLHALYAQAGQALHWQQVLGAFFFALLLSLGLFIAPSGRPGTPLRCKDYFLMALVLAFFSIGAKIVFWLGESSSDAVLSSALPYAFPVAGAVGIVAMVFAARRYCTMGLLLSFFTMMMFEGGVSLFLFYFLGGMLATWLVTRAQSRQDVVWSIVPLTVGQICIWLASCLLAQPSWSFVPAQLLAVVGNSVISLLTLFALSPVLELTFGYTTRFRLMELMSLEQPLMQEIMMTMPGTYHHSLVVANMVEAGAKAIGANSLLCKVAALYHDVGKLMHPEYFIENQYGGVNKHDSLAPSMSALILQAHVKKGTELAQTNGLGQEIIDIIRQHHGTRSMRYFYQKACTLGESPRETDYSYPGPKPQTKEAAILMLADSVEASSRTLSEPTPARISTHIDTIMKGIFSEGQLDEAELTFKDLHRLSETFARILTGIFHQRIVYPQGGKAPPSASDAPTPVQNDGAGPGARPVAVS